MLDLAHYTHLSQLKAFLEGLELTLALFLHGVQKTQGHAGVIGLCLWFASIEA